MKYIGRHTIQSMYAHYRGSLVAQMVKKCLQCRDLGLIPGLGRPLEEGMATHSSILAWRIPWTEEPGEYRPWGREEPDNRATQHSAQHTFLARALVCIKYASVSNALHMCVHTQPCC